MHTLLAESGKPMKAEYEFSKGKRGAVMPQKGKTRISIFIDNSTLAEFLARAEKAGTGYQTMILRQEPTLLAVVAALVLPFLFTWLR